MSRVSIAAGSQTAADAGAAVAEAGGNAVDAAVASCMASMCIDPGIIAPGAGGFVSIWPADGDPVVIDGYSVMPGLGASPARFGDGGIEITMAYGGGITTIVGPGSVAVPGAIAALGAASSRYGVLPWRELIAPAIDAVRDGFPLSPPAAEYMSYAHKLVFGWQHESHRVLHHEDGRHLAAGETVRVPDLVRSLQTLASEGPESLYTGTLAAAVVAAMEEAGGLITADDLAAYEPVVRRPVRVKLGEWDIATNAPPAVGGTVLAAMLALAELDPIHIWDAEAVARMADIQRIVTQHRRSTLDLADDRTRAAERLLALARAGDLAAIGSPSTTHTSTVDTDGLACAITASAGYGSGMIIPGTGMWMNNSLGEVELNPHGFHSLTPGTRLVSNMAPTVARSIHGATMAIGTPGADRITTALSTVFINFAQLGLALHEAIAHPRMHSELFNGEPTLAYEPGIDVQLVAGMVKRRFPDLSMYFGGVQAALHDPAGGLYEAADPRRRGGTARGGDA